MKKILLSIGLTEIQLPNHYLSRALKSPQSSWRTGTRGRLLAVADDKGRYVNVGGPEAGVLPGQSWIGLFALDPRTCNAPPKVGQVRGISGCGLVVEVRLSGRPWSFPNRGTT